MLSRTNYLNFTNTRTAYILTITAHLFKSACMSIGTKVTAIFEIYFRTATYRKSLPK